MSGRVVMEETLAPAQVMVTVDGTKTGTLANSEGRYMLLNVPAGLQRVTASSIGLITERRSVFAIADPVRASSRCRSRCVPGRSPTPSESGVGAAVSF